MVDVTIRITTVGKGLAATTLEGEIIAVGSSRAIVTGIKTLLDNAIKAPKDAN